MNRSIKNILAIAALTLTFAPALRCEDAQEETPSTSKLQSVINYVKNIRTPLTPQEQLAQHIVRADATGFKDTYNSFQNWPADERAAALQALAVTTQEVKQALQTELETNGDKANKFTLAKGVAQTILGTYCTLVTMFSLAYKGEYFAINRVNLDRSFMLNLANRLEDNYLYINGPEILPFCLRLDGYQKLAALTNIIVTPLTGYLAYNSLKAGIQNCKNGWNYKAFVEQQIANIDEINAFIQEQLK